MARATPNPTLRQLTPDDPALSAVTTLVAEAFPPGSGRASADLSREDLSAMTAAGPAFVMEIQGQVCGCAFSRPSDFQAGALYLGPAVVAPACQGMGHGRLLIDAMDEIGQAEGFCGLVVAVETSEDHLASFYEHLGFRWLRDGTGCRVFHRA